MKPEKKNLNIEKNIIIIGFYRNIKIFIIIFN